MTADSRVVASACSLRGCAGRYINAAPLASGATVVTLTQPRLPPTAIPTATRFLQPPPLARSSPPPGVSPVPPPLRHCLGWSSQPPSPKRAALSEFYPTMAFKQAVLTALATLLLLTLTLSTTSATAVAAPGAVKVATPLSAAAAVRAAGAESFVEAASVADADEKNDEEEEEDAKEVLTDAAAMDASARSYKKCCRWGYKYRCIKYRKRKCIHWKVVLKWCKHWC